MVPTQPLRVVNAISSRPYIGRRPGKQRSTLKTAAKIGGVATVLSTIGYLGIDSAIKSSPKQWEAKNPALVQAAQKGDYNEYDRLALQTHTGLKDSIAPTLLRHWKLITEMAGNKYNTLAVADTLSRAPGGLEGLQTEIEEQEAAAKRGDEKAARKLEMFKKLRELAVTNRTGVERMLNDLVNLKSSQIEYGREVFYRGSWKRGDLRSKSNLVKSAPTAKPTSLMPNRGPQNNMSRGEMAQRQYQPKYTSGKARSVNTNFRNIQRR